MSNRKTIPGLRDFLKDLKAIREKHKVSHEQVYYATKVNVQLIDEFENNGLIDHNLFNHLYLRAFVRSYSEVVGINPDKAVAYYESALNGGYERQLAISYLEFERPPRPVKLGEAQDKKAQEEISDPIEVVTESFSDAEKAKAKAMPEEVEEEIETPATVTEKARSQVEQALLDSDEEEPAWKRVERVPVLGEAIATVRKAITSTTGPQSQNPMLQWALVASVLVIISILLFFLLRGGEEYISDEGLNTAGPDATEEISTVPAGSQDSLADAAPALQQLSAEQIASIVEADSIPVWVVAEVDRLAPFRVQVDNDLRRPYWLDQGDSTLFFFDRRMVVEEGLDLMRIQVDTFQYSTTFVDASGRLIINRDSLTTFLQQITYEP